MEGIRLFILNIFPDLFKGMLNGIIMALGISYKGIYVHILCHWIIYPLLIFIFPFQLNLGISGFWMAKVGLEWSIVTMYLYIISTSDWDEISKRAVERQKREERSEKD
jgi:Na+-driven multidrug efflux pump